MYAQTLAADHQLVGIAHVRLGGALLLNERYSDAVAESHSGYEILMKQASPPANWLQKARTDLVEEYDALKQPEQAAKYRAELTAEKDTAISKKN